MKSLIQKLFWLWFVALALVPPVSRADLVISEILFNPPSDDLLHEYIELRGIPNLTIPQGTCLLTVDGDAGADPGTVQNVFNLSGRTVGGDGFLLLLQKANPYTANSNAAVLVNTNSGAGWGSGSTSSVGHRGKSGLAELRNPSVTFFLIQTTNTPAPGEDLDGNDNGTIDTAVLADWKVLDSVGVLDEDGAGDIAYGNINFRMKSLPGSGAMASGTIVPVGFVPRYIGRVGNNTGSASSDWVASDGLDGTAPNWVLGATTNILPIALAGRALNHLGAPNFGAPAIPGIVVQPGNAATILEGTTNALYTLALNTAPTGAVTIQLRAGPRLSISTDGGASFGSTGVIVMTNQMPKTVTVHAQDDNVVDRSPYWIGITNQVIASKDLSRYPLTSIVPQIQVGIVDNEFALLSELKVNPPGTNDAPFEFVEIRGTPGSWLTNVYLLAIDGNGNGNPGTVTLSVDLTGKHLGANGLLLLTATNQPYVLPALTTLVTDPQLDIAGSGLGNGTISFLLVTSPSALSAGQDLDKGNNGVLEGLPEGTTLLDAVGWSDGDKGDVVYGGVTLNLSSGTPDAATRLPADNTPKSAAAWFCGDLAGTNGDSLVYDANQISANFPDGSTLTPGLLGNATPVISPVGPMSGVIGDLGNPKVFFTVSDLETASDQLIVSATSANRLVVPDTNLVITVEAGGQRSLSLDPVGVGYSDITLWASDGMITGKVKFRYAASAMGRPGGVWHLGSSDASTAIAVNGDYMLVGDDENQIIRLYERGHSGLVVNQFDLGPFLDLPDVQSGLPREVDIEASTRVGNRLFWMGSLGHARDGESRTNRTRVFATDLSIQGASSTISYGGRYDFLKVDLIEWDKQNLHGKGANYYGLDASDAPGVPPKAPDGSGFAIEGLAMMPGSTNGAYVAFRAPIIPATNRNYALIVPVLNFATVAASGGPAGACVFGSPIELDLYGRGIRSLEGNSNGYVLVAGPAGGTVGAYPQDFRLYTWTGNPLDLPRQRTADLSELNPEGIVELPLAPWTTNTTVELLTDDGAVEFYGDGLKAKELPIPSFKKFRSDRVAIGEVTKPMPIILSNSLMAGVCTIQWRALKGETYWLEAATDLGAADWEAVPGEVVALGPYASVAVPSDGTRRFYRVVMKNY
ncbi:MAG TPA: DUF3616 domain-containing protein [Clostridia bacterium]|nr:DUF3616 domain-containing protein [Clostridia bacterium]